MDLEEIGSLLIMIALAVISGLIQRKKKQKSAAKKTRFVTDEMKIENDLENDFEEDVAEENFNYKNDIFEENSSKFESYFTYEEVREKETDYAQKKEPIAKSKCEDNLQDSENEEETNFIDFSDPQELRKAIIYKEILETPYN